MKQRIKKKSTYSRESYLKHRDKHLAKGKRRQAEKAVLVKCLKEMSPEDLLEWMGYL